MRRAPGLALVAALSMLATGCVADVDPVQVAADFREIHPGCELLDVAMGRRHSSQASVDITYRCGDAELQRSNLLYLQSHGGWEFSGAEGFAVEDRP